MKQTFAAPKRAIKVLNEPMPVLNVEGMEHNSGSEDCANKRWFPEDTNSRRSRRRHDNAADLLPVYLWTGAILIALSVLAVFIIINTNQSHTTAILALLFLLALTIRIGWRLINRGIRKVFIPKDQKK